MKISIVIPRHDETPEFMFHLFSSINNQVGIDFNDIEVIVVNDIEGNTLPDDYFETYKNIKDVKQYYNPQIGYMGVSRDLGWTKSEGEWIIFVDSDDMLYTPTVLAEYFKRINEMTPDKTFDILTTAFVEECRDPNDNLFFQVHNTRDMTWMFAKLYSKKFLEEKNIHFSPNLRVHEDSYFNLVARCSGARVGQLEVPTYLWRYNKASITRKNEAEYSFTSIVDFIDAIEEGIATLKERELPYEETVMQLLSYIYNLLQTNQWRTERAQKHIKRIERRLLEFMMRYKDEIQKIDEAKFSLILLNEHNSQSQKSGVYFLRESYNEFVTRIQREKFEDDKRETARKMMFLG